MCDIYRRLERKGSSSRPRGGGHALRDKKKERGRGREREGEREAKIKTGPQPSVSHKLAKTETHR